MSQRQYSVLVVDDDPTLRRLLRAWLEAAEYVVREAADGEEAMASILDDCPDVVLTDWDMPNISGMMLCRWLRDQNLPRYVYTLVLTAREGSQALIRALDAGADDFVKKPCHKDELMARLRASSRVLAMESRLSLLAKCDPLTGLATQRTLFEQMEREWVRAVRHHIPLSCIMLDIDFFKRINDTLGHAVGDEVIRRVARVLIDNTRNTDLVSRYGGEEFCVLLPEIDERNAVILAERLRRAIADEEIRSDSHEFTITCSFGVAERLSDVGSPEELVDMADQALLVAKRSGRNRVISHRSLCESEQTSAADPRFGRLLARDAMTTIVAGLRHDQQLGQAAEYFLRFRINSAPVVNEQGKLVGILSEKDVMAVMLWPKWWTTRVSEVMTANVVSYEENTPLQIIYDFLCRVSIRGAVVVSGGRPVGIISRGSVLRWFTSSMRVEMGHRADAAVLELSPAEMRATMQTTAGSIQSEIDRLARPLMHSEPRDLVPHVVGAASRVQELATDLLAQARHLVDSDGESSWEDARPAASKTAPLCQGAVAAASWPSATG